MHQAAAEEMQFPFPIVSVPLLPFLQMLATKLTINMVILIGELIHKPCLIVEWKYLAFVFGLLSALFEADSEGQLLSQMNFF